MILVVASSVDDTARTLVREWEPDEATLLIPHDLSLPGWVVEFPPNGRSVAVASGVRIPEQMIRGVVTTLPCIFPSELVHIDPEDRLYVAAEMTAFLRYWLSLLPCRVVNRPTSSSLSGPNWSTELWLRVAAEAGIPTARRQRITGDTTASTTRESAPRELGSTLTVVGNRVIGSGKKAAVHAARRLATAAGVDLLTVGFTQKKGTWHVAGASPFADLGNPLLRSAIREYVRNGHEAGDGRSIRGIRP